MTGQTPAIGWADASHRPRPPSRQGSQLHCIALHFCAPRMPPTPRSRKFSWKFVETNQFRAFFGRLSAFGNSRATRCQNSRLLRRRLVNPKTSQNESNKYRFFWSWKSVEQYVRKAMGSMFERRWAVRSKGNRQYAQVLRKGDRVALPGDQSTAPHFPFIFVTVGTSGLPGIIFVPSYL